MALDQATKNRGDKHLNIAIKIAQGAALEACKMGDLPGADPIYHEIRDKAYMVLGLLYQAKSVAGGIVGPDITTKAGSK
ncbi:hypothetical protein [Profundibacter sp.]